MVALFNRVVRTGAAVLLLAFLQLPGWPQQGATSSKKPYAYVPDTVSPQAQRFLQNTTDPALIPALPSIADVQTWEMVRKGFEGSPIVAVMQTAVDESLKKYQPSVTERVIGGVPVFDVKPRGWKNDGRVLIYTHGGAYVFGGGRLILLEVLPVAELTGLRVIAVDYTLAPFAKWQQVTDQVVAVMIGLQKEAYPLNRMAIYGDSAGGGLAAGAVLKMRDKGLGMPAAVVLWSPWADITETGDTYTTLKDAEPMYRYDTFLKPAANAYADPKDQKNPYVSPVYGDYSKEFPPTLIQRGTKEIFLSNFVREYQALDSAGQPVKLDLYEGMTHVFQVTIPDAPETKLALRKMNQFLNQYLGK